MAVKSKKMHKKPLSKYILKLCQSAAAAQLNPFYDDADDDDEADDYCYYYYSDYDYIVG